MRSLVKPQMILSRTSWGVDHLSIPEFVAKVGSMHEEGYRCVEIPLLFIMQFGTEKFRLLLQNYEVDYIPLIFSDGFLIPAKHSFTNHPHEGRTVAHHVAVLKAQLDELERSKLLEHIPYINSHRYLTVLTASPNV